MCFNINMSITTTQIILSYFTVFGVGMFIAAEWSDIWKPSVPGIVGLIIGLSSALVYLGTRLG